MVSKDSQFERRLNPLEMTHSKVPISNISLIATISVQIDLNNLRNIIQQMQIRHPILNSQLQYKGNELWFVRSEHLVIPITVIPRTGEDQWKTVIFHEHKVPFQMELGPLIRFILLQSNEVSDLILFCHHVICDGLSLAYLARDIMVCMGNPSNAVEILPLSTILDEKSFPADIKLPCGMKIIGTLIKKKWQKQEIFFDFGDFYELHNAFWKNYDYKVQLCEFSKEETASLIDSCHKHNITVNTVLLTAFAIAQNHVNLSKAPYLSKCALAVNLRKSLSPPVEDQFGFFASGCEIQFDYKPTDTLWTAAKRINSKASFQIVRKKALIAALMKFQLPLTISEAQLYAAFGHVIPSSSPSYPKIHAFINDNDNLAVKMIKKRLSKGLAMAQIITNLGRMDFPEKFGNLKLHRLILMPSCSPFTELVLGVVTHGGILCITLNHMESTINTEKMNQIREYACHLLKEALKE